MGVGPVGIPLLVRSRMIRISYLVTSKETAAQFGDVGLFGAIANSP